MYMMKQRLRYGLWILLFPLMGHAAEVVPLDRLVAIVNDEVVTANQLARQLQMVRQQLQSRQTTLPPPEVLRKQVLERIVLTRIQAQQAQQMGLRVDDETLNRALQRIAAQNKLALPEFKAAIEREGVSYAQFRDDIRQEILLSRLKQRQVDSHVIVTEQEIDQALEQRMTQTDPDDEFRLGHILFAVPEGATPEKLRSVKDKAQQVWESLRAGADFRATAVAVSEGRQALEGGDLGWRKAAQLPALFAPVAQRLQVGEISEVLQNNSGFHIIKLLEQRSAQPSLVTQTLARHILLRPNDILSNEEAASRLEALRLRVLQGEDFAVLAKSISEDKISASLGGDLGWITPGDMAPEFEAALNELEPGALSKPFRTEFGWHLAQVLERRQQDMSKDQKRRQVADTLRQRKIEEELQLWLRRLRDEAYVEYLVPDDETT